MRDSSRRRFLQALAAVGRRAHRRHTLQRPLRFADDPFSLGVASGYPATAGDLDAARARRCPANAGLDPVASLCAGK
jgi:phosphodiesterase/alkaline phosphatase D-like protein